MMSFKPIKRAKEAAQYYEHLAVEDYYESGGEPPGLWLGDLRNDLFLHGQLQHGELAHLLQGKHPTTGEALASNAGEQHKPGWDMTFSAPKSVSVIWALADSESRLAIQRAQAKAVESGLSFLQAHAFSNRDRALAATPVNKVIAAAYEHGTSRECDPQLHTHVLVANLGMRENGSFSALDFDSRWKMAAGAVYRAELSAQLQELGYSIEPDVKNSFVVSGVSPELCKLFSKHRQAIVEQAEEHGVTSAAGMQIATFATRQDKGEAIPRAKLFAAWRAETLEGGFSTDLVEQCRQFNISVGKIAAPQEIFETLNQQMSTFTPMQLHAAIAVAAQGHLDATGVDQYAEELFSDPELVRLQAHNSRLDRGIDSLELRYTTQTQLALEQSLLDQAKSRELETQHQINADHVPVECATLTKEQRTAFDHITVESGAVKIVQGMAGTGKGYMLGVAHQAWQAAGLEVRGSALAAKAANNLQESTQIPSQTLHSLIYELNIGKTQLTENTVLVLDEAGMVGSRQLANILNHVHQSGAKAVLVGDSRQLQPIDAGGAFRLLADELGHASLQHIQRQHDAVDRKIVEQFAAGQSAEALDAIRQQGNLHVKPTYEQALQSMVDDWWRAGLENPDSSALMMAGTRSDLHQLNQLARSKMHSAGLFGASCEVDTSINEVRSDREFAIGDRILFCKNQRYLGIINGESGTLSAIHLHPAGYWQFTVDRDDGRSVMFSLTDNETVKNRYESIDHGYALSVHKAQGVTVDQSFVLTSDAMMDQEWTYVASSRARHKTQIYCTSEIEQQLEQLIGRSRQKDTSLDYAVPVAPETKLQSGLEL